MNDPNLRYLSDFDPLTISTASNEVFRARTGEYDAFYFDTTGAGSLGDDIVRNFGAGDRIITRTKLSDPNGDGISRLNSSDKLVFDDGVGSLKIFNENGKAVSGLLLWDTATFVDAQGVSTTFYVYSAAGDNTPYGGFDPF